MPAGGDAQCNAAEMQDCRRGEETQRIFQRRGGPGQFEAVRVAVQKAEQRGDRDAGHDRELQRERASKPSASSETAIPASTMGSDCQCIAIPAPAASMVINVAGSNHIARAPPWAAHSPTANIASRFEAGERMHQARSEAGEVMSGMGERHAAGTERGCN